MRVMPGMAVVLAAVLGLSGCAMEMGPSVFSDQLSQKQYFSLPDLNEKNVSLEYLLSQHKAVLVNFFATWCPPCQEEIPDLIELQNRHAERGFSVIGIDVEESAKKVRAFAERYEINYPVLLDGDGRTAQAYGLVGVPTTFLIDSSGRVLGVYHAFTKKLVADVEKALA